MGLRVPWQDQYLICQSSTISEAKDFSAGSIGLDADKYVLPLVDPHPHMELGQATIETPKALGISDKRSRAPYEFQRGIRSPIITLETDCNKKTLGLLLWLLLQGGLNEGVSPGYLKTASAYLTASPEIYCNIVRVMSADSADSFRMRGAICKSLTISGREGESIKLSANLIGAYIDTDFNASSAVYAWTEEDPLLFGDITNVDVDGTKDIKLDSFSISVDNQAIRKFYNNQETSGFILGKLLVTASFVFTWSTVDQGGMTLFDKLKAPVGPTAESESRLVIGLLGSPIMTQFFDVAGVLKNVSLVSEEQAKISVELEGARVDPGASNSAIHIKVKDYVNRGIT